MKKIYIILLLILTTSIIAYSQTDTQKDSTANSKETIQSSSNKKKATATITYTPSYTDTDDEGMTVVSTTVDGDSTTVTQLFDRVSYTFDDDDLGFIEGIRKVTAGSIIFLVFLIILIIFALPLLIILLILYFRNRNRRERYRVVEKAIEAGQPIPNEILKENLNIDTEAKGISNMCLGAGLFIFLWLITNSLGIGCIGVLVAFIGLGQYLVARQNRQFNQDETLKEKQNRGTNANGIKYMCLGVGSFFFLWLITHSIALGCIGVLIFFIGLGQFLATYNNSKRNNNDNRE